MLDIPVYMNVVLHMIVLQYIHTYLEGTYMTYIPVHDIHVHTSSIHVKLHSVCYAYKFIHSYIMYSRLKQKCTHNTHTWHDLKISYNLNVAYACVYVCTCIHVPRYTGLTCMCSTYILDISTKVLVLEDMHTFLIHVCMCTNSIILKILFFS